VTKQVLQVNARMYGFKRGGLGGRQGTDPVRLKVIKMKPIRNSKLSSACESKKPLTQTRKRECPGHGLSYQRRKPEDVEPNQRKRAS